ncbi:uncharacterized protein LOC123313155 isoform X1 [Coccinella septempunctata]|uniref:uncharacterized protein LOC123313155 isoform X1 n=1 Tax=Coccinella septempunctata TaxID=41139 RepID=UPI001D091796|nr:uncharacterized protein LOC123313155 isoform X1 [Coccinella septempunctata]
MFREIAQYVRKCSKYHRYKVPQQKPASNHLVEEPCENDRFSKWMEFRPMRTAVQRGVYQAFKEDGVNSPKQESTGNPRAILNFDRKMRSPNTKFSAEIANKDGRDHTKPDTEPQVAYHVNNHNQFTEIFKFVRTRLTQAFAQQSHYNLRRRDWRHRIGDQVY